MATSTIAPSGPPRAKSELAIAAIRCAEEGLRVFPVAATKRPLTRHGVKDASSDVPHVARWWTAFPNAHIGLATGDGIVVLDIDTKHGGEVDASWPATLSATTPSAGIHLFYATNVPIQNSVGHLARGVDVRGKNGYVVIPPSPGRSWHNPGTPVAPLPQRIIDQLLRPRSGGAETARSNAFEPRDRVDEGGRNDYIAQFTGWCLHHGLPESELVDFVMDHNLKVCVPPLDREEVARTAASIARRERASGRR